MNHSEFSIGAVFYTLGKDGWLKWQCTDVGTRTVVAIRLDQHEIITTEAGVEIERRLLNEQQARAEGWFNGPPYAVTEVVFHEYDIDGCYVDPDEDAED